MDYLWAPWRLSYVTNTGRLAGQSCVFCSELDSSESSSLKLHVGDQCFVILNKYPYNNGHLLVVPKRHFAKLAEALPSELSELMSLTGTAERVLSEAYDPDGLNIGINIGRSAGAGVPGHLHIHVVPRWDGDTNFMTVTSETRVMPEEPRQTVERLKPLFQRFS